MNSFQKEEDSILDLNRSNAQFLSKTNNLAISERNSFMNNNDSTFKDDPLNESNGQDLNIANGAQSLNNRSKDYLQNMHRNNNSMAILLNDSNMSGVIQNNDISDLDDSQDETVIPTYSKDPPINLEDALLKI